MFAFDEQDAPPGLGNYWGYQPLSFFAPHPGYSSRPDPLGALDEFRDMVKALHRAGIEVILDVVYNHTAEGDDDGPTLCFRGFGNEPTTSWPTTESRYADYTGCGNTLNANRSDRPAADPRQPALLGQRDARRRLPLRSRLDPVARRAGPPDGSRRRSSGTSSRIRCSPMSS